MKNMLRFKQHKQHTLSPIIQPDHYKVCASPEVRRVPYKELDSDDNDISKRKVARKDTVIFNLVNTISSQKCLSVAASPVSKRVTINLKESMLDSKIAKDLAGHEREIKVFRKHRNLRQKNSDNTVSNLKKLVSLNRNGCSKCKSPDTKLHEFLQHQAQKFEHSKDGVMVGKRDEILIEP